MRRGILLLLPLVISSVYALRLDQALVERKICASRSVAARLIKSGCVTVGGKTVTKPAFAVNEDSAVVAQADESGFVSRAGDKLAAALTGFRINPVGKHVLDVGASTGGFTDALLKAGALSATCVDCGHGQLHESLESDARVTSMEGVNARYLERDMLPRDAYDLVVIDVSFISLTLVLPAIWPLLDAASPDARLVALVKPQFELGKQAVSKGKGVVKDPAICEQALSNIADFASADLEGCAVVGSMVSPILGGDGQMEFLIAFAQDAHVNEEQRGPFYSSANDQSTTVAEAAPRDEEAISLTVEPIRAVRPTTSAARAAKFNNKRRKAAGKEF